jgi:hypothetical protein
VFSFIILSAKIEMSPYFSAKTKVRWSPNLLPSSFGGLVSGSVPSIGGVFKKCQFLAFLGSNFGKKAIGMEATKGSGEK